MPIERGKAGLILLGAQEFPRSNNFGASTAFFNSYKRIKDFFCDPQGIAFSDSEVLDLFDSDDSPDELDNRIARFISAKKNTHGLSDLIIYYTGHGGYASQNGGFLLATRSTRDENLGVSSITLKSLSVTISKCAKDIRTFLILDCCFAGDAVPSFQSGQVEILKKQVENDFPSKGIALLCSASKDLPSIIIEKRNITMFTEGLEMALRKGTSIIPNRYLTLRQLQELAFNYIKELNPGEFVRPEVHTPDQQSGDIADIPHFPNYGFRQNPYDIKERRKTIELKIIENDLSSVCKLFMDFIYDFDIQKKYEVEMVLLAAECNALEEEMESSAINRSTYKEERKNLYVKILNILRDLMSGL